MKALVELCVSQINSCAYYIDLHANKARKLGVTQQRLDCLTVWKECQLFSDREMAAVSWAECVTNISTETDIQSKLSGLLKHYNEVEAVDLTLIISLMNCMNRMAINFRDKPEKHVP